MFLLVGWLVWCREIDMDRRDLAKICFLNVSLPALKLI